MPVTETSVENSVAIFSTTTGSSTVRLLYRKILYMTQVRDQRCLSGLSLCTTSLLKALVTFVIADIYIFDIVWKLLDIEIYNLR